MTTHRLKPLFFAAILALTAPACSEDSAGGDATLHADKGPSTDALHVDQGHDTILGSDGNPDGPKPECVVPCDCPEGKTCLNSTCIPGPIVGYCCNRADCPAGKVCSNPGGDPPDVCPSTTGCDSHCDCDQGTPCLGSTHAGKKDGSCIGGAGAVRYCCTKAGCVDTGSKCQMPDGSERDTCQ